MTLNDGSQVLVSCVTTSCEKGRYTTTAALTSLVQSFIADAHSPERAVQIGQALNDSTGNACQPSMDGTSVLDAGITQMSCAACPGDIFSSCGNGTLSRMPLSVA